MRTIPMHLATLAEATESDFRTVFGDPTQGDQYFAIGTPLTMDIPICIDLERLVERTLTPQIAASAGVAAMNREVYAGIDGFMASNHVRAIGYVCLALVVLLALAGLVTGRPDAGRNAPVRPTGAIRPATAGSTRRSCGRTPRAVAAGPNRRRAKRLVEALARQSGAFGTMSAGRGLRGVLVGREPLVARVVEIVVIGRVARLVWAERAFERNTVAFEPAEVFDAPVAEVAQRFVRNDALYF